MIPNEVVQTLDTVGDGIQIVGNFDITNQTKARILVSLSDKMYTRKELAAIREYSTNAADAHIVANNPISDIQVTLPTTLHPSFKIRDFGSGLTQEQIANVYCIFGESTKRNSNEQNGMLGYGCKSGFSVSDSFFVTSWIDGYKTIYQCIKGDSTKLHSAIRLIKEPSDEPTGIEISIPIKNDKIWTFVREATDFYKFWDVIPTFLSQEQVIEEIQQFKATAPVISGDGWDIRTKRDGCARGVALMGLVPYEINWNILSHHMSMTSQKRVMFDIIQSNDVSLYFKMGEVQFTDSRESLEYTDFTINALLKKLEHIFEHVKDAFQAKFDAAPNFWEAKYMYGSIFQGYSHNEDEEIEDRLRFLDGDLSMFEKAMKGMFTWNDAVLDNYGFSGIYAFDSKTKPLDTTSSLMVTYRKKNSRIAKHRCMDSKHNTIYPSNKVVVVINDINSKSGQAVVARYLIHTSNKNLRTVHILTFADASIKAKFYETYNFHTVPVLNFSEILPLAKEWNKSNNVVDVKKTAADTNRRIKYYDVANDYMSFHYGNMRDLEDGGYFIPLTASEFYNEDSYFRHIKNIIKQMKLDVDRIYFAPMQTAESKWFATSIEDGVWTNIKTHIIENFLGFDVEFLKNCNKYAQNYRHRFNTTAVNAVIEGVADRDCPVIPLLKAADLFKHDDFSFCSSLQYVDIWDKVIDNENNTIDYDTMYKNVERKYPLLNISNDFSHDYKSGHLAHVITYINAIDFFTDMMRTQVEINLEENLQTA